jgi:hypothetical protein
MSMKKHFRAGCSQTAPHDLHNMALGAINDLLGNLEGEATNPDVAKAVRDVERLVAPIRNELADRIRALKRHARWDTFVIAFYGETNAGKSTIIDTMRSLLGESTKTDARNAFRALQTEHGLTEEGLRALQESIDSSRSKLAALSARAVEDEARIEAQKRASDDELRRLTQLVASKKQRANFFIRLLYHCSKMREQFDVEAAEQRQSEITARLAAEREHAIVEHTRAEHALRDLQAKQECVRSALEELSRLADGQIIGNGRSDYTLETQSYSFHADDQRFELLDVPGIEGKETRVIDNILSAVKTAHAVFYITGKAAPPQTGDSSGQGTLEKIRMHLGDQTEVYTIYNKRVTNPIALDKGVLVSQGERDSLAVLDETMRKHLGVRYQGHITLSAYPAFLAVSDCLVPGSGHERSRAKFLDKASVDELLSKCGVAKFADWLKHDVVSDCDKRIRAANVNKVRASVQQARDDISLMQREELAPLVAKIRRNWSDAGRQIDKAFAKVASTLETTADGNIRKLEARLRKKMYDLIEDGLDNDQLQVALGENIQELKQSFETELLAEAEAVLERFQQELSGILARFEQRVEELQSSFHWQGSSDSGSKFNIVVDRGVNYVSLLAALASTALLFLAGPMAPLAVVFSVLGTVIGVAKAVRSMFDSEYKKSQQRSAVNTNIARITARMQAASSRSIEGTTHLLQTKVEEIRADLQRSVDQAKLVNQALVICCSDLGKLASAMQREMSHGTDEAGFQGKPGGNVEGAPRASVLS